ncbi:MAG TPA: methyltransferase [Steroidobacteraceae bacterium]|nr:methyltransferase [Steroidobacteraceae bacterium]
MTLATLGFPRTDPTPIFDAFRGNYSTELLTAAVTHFKLFERLKDGPRSFAALRAECGLGERGALVLVTAMRALKLLTRNADGALELSEYSREHLILGAPFDISGYIGLAAEGVGVKELIERLCTNTPAGASDKTKGAAFIYREGIESAMETEASARHLTMMLAGRAKNCAPALAHGVPLNKGRRLLDVGGGTGIYSIALLQKNPQLRAVVWDRPEVLKVAAQMARDYGVTDRLECRAGDMFIDPFPVDCDVILLSNVLHDWDVPQCRALLERCAAALPTGGRVLIHDVFLNDELDGPLPVALYSGALFYLTEGRAYSGAEYREWLSAVGLTPGTIVPTLVHCGVLPATK